MKGYMMIKYRNITEESTENLVLAIIDEEEEVDDVQENGLSLSTMAPHWFSS